MIKLLITAFAFILKGAFIYFAIKYALSLYDLSLPFHTQNPIVWVFVYFPIVVGYESLIETILEIIKSKIKKQE